MDTKFSDGCYKEKFKIIMMNIVIRKFGRKVKAWYFRHKYHLSSVDKTVYFGGKSAISRDLIAGRYVYVGPNCVIYPNVMIGSFTMLANNVSIIGGDHKYSVVGLPIMLTGRDVIKKTVIGEDCWIGAHAIIMCGTHIADGCIVAAGAIITKDTEPYCIYAGVPAKKIKSRFSSDEDIRDHIESMKKLNDEEIIERLLENKKLKESKKERAIQ